MQSLNIYFTGQNQVETQNGEVAAPNNDQILLRSRRSLISTGTEGIVLERKFAPGTHWDNWIKYPFAPGYLCAGEVVEAGANSGFAPGDRVAARTPHHQFALAHPSQVLPIPADVSDEEAAWFGLAKITQNGVRKAELEMGDVVVIIGLGLLGQLVTQYARLMGASEIIAVDTVAMRLDMARAHGATHTFAMGAEQAREPIRELTQGRMADVVFDVTGFPAVLSQALPLARRFGTLLLLGDAGTPSEQRLTSDVVTRGVKIVGAHDGDAPPVANDYLHWTQENMGRLFFNYLGRDQMRVRDLVTHTFSPHDAAQAYALLTTERAKAMGVMFDWDRL